MIAFELPGNVTPSQAIDGIADLALECISDDGVIHMDRDDSEGFVEVLRAIARYAHATEARLAELQRAASPSCVG
jgi:hypothetical protein